MPAAKPTRPATRPRQTMPIGETVDAFTVRGIAQAAQRAADQLRDRSVLVVDLVVGDNVINHGLGRAPTGVNVTPTVADFSWAYAMKSPTETTVNVFCIGVPQPGAAIEVF